MSDICKHIFRHPETQDWPPRIVKLKNWDALYAEQVADLPVAKDVDSAIDWVNGLVRKITSLKN